MKTIKKSWKGYIICNPKTGRPENGSPEIYKDKVVTHSKQEICVPCVLSWEISITAKK